MGSINELSWSESSGKQGGSFGLDVNFKKGTIVTNDGKNLPIKGYEKDVVWVIENNIEAKTKKRDKFQFKIDVKEEIRVPIKDGYQLHTPLNESEMERFTGRVSELTEEITTLAEMKKKYEE